jgi:phenylalanyl-tRNA synthetase beta chain
MKFTLSWLFDHLETTASCQALCEALTEIGFEVEGVYDPTSELTAFTVCQIESVTSHPNAEKLNICQVNTGKETVQIICGAPNVYAGMKAVFAPPKTYIPGIDTTIRETKIRGEFSQGMLCSEKELLLSDEHDGIIELSQDSLVGGLMTDCSGIIDPVITINVTPNRPDMLGVIGIARDLSARGVGTFRDRLPPYMQTEKKADGVSSINVTIDNDVVQYCPFFTGCYIRNVHCIETPRWLSKRLCAVGLRTVNFLVDITNYILLDRCRPLHVFDADKIKGNLRIREALKGEKFTALDGKIYELNALDLVISDNNGIQSLAGIMGGQATGCSENTVNVFLESATFDPIHIAKTGRELKIISDSRYRFERGVDPLSAPDGLAMATAMITNMCGGTFSTPVNVGSNMNKLEQPIVFKPDYVKKMTGMHVSEQKQKHILQALGFLVEESKDIATPHIWNVTCPSWRQDVSQSADLVEEVARIYSYSQLQSTPLPNSRDDRIPVKSYLPSHKIAKVIRKNLAVRGMFECITYTFIDDSLNKWIPSALSASQATQISMQIENPISPDMSTLRSSLLPGLLKAGAKNCSRSIYNFSLFEIGNVFYGGQPQEEQIVAAGLRCGSSPHEIHWDTKRRDVDFFDAKADVNAIFRALGIEEKTLRIEPLEGATYHPGQAAKFVNIATGKQLAICGKIHPELTSYLDFSVPVVAFEIFMDQLSARKISRERIVLSDFQPVTRDLSFIVHEDIPAGDIRDCIYSGNKLIRSVFIFDVFEGSKAQTTLGSHKKSIAMSISIQPTTATLSEKQIHSIVDKIISTIKKKFDGELRSF